MKEHLRKVVMAKPMLAIPLSTIHLNFGISRPTARKAMYELEIPAYNNWPFPWKNKKRKFVDSRDMWKFHGARFFSKYLTNLRRCYPGEEDKFAIEKLYPPNEEEFSNFYKGLYTVNNFLQKVNGHCDISKDEIPDLLFCNAIPYDTVDNDVIMIEPFFVKHILTPGHPTGDYIGYEGPYNPNKVIYLV